MVGCPRFSGVPDRVDHESMNPEQQARQEIDRQLEACGWEVQSRDRLNITAGPGVAVREFPLKTGQADYLLYVDARVIGVIEAKPAGHTLAGVEVQSARYADALPDGLPTHLVPLPFAYESTGTNTQFTNFLDPQPRSRRLFSFHRPEELHRLVKLDRQLRGELRSLPPLNTERLWSVQAQAIASLERSLAADRPRALIQMATGTGKTFTAVNSIYRLIKFANARRVLFLIDRANLGRQTHREFQQFASPHTGYTFTEEFNVQHLRSNAIDPVSRVCITTIQRLYSMLKGEEEFEEGNEEQSLFEIASPLFKQPVPVSYNARVPIEAFDFIVTDECHRSIYNLWRQVLEYFDAFLIGLTATPTKQTIGFFDNNLVMQYGHSDAMADGVNVGYDVFRILTKVSRDGATLKADPGIFVPHRERKTRRIRYEELDDDLTYTADELDRDVVAEDQIRLVVRTFRDRLPTEIFPGRTEVPKTVVFAKDDSHAEDITRIIREEFGRGNDFCQKITYRTTGKKPEDLLAEFRNSFNPRIAVTVDMIATGTDVKPLECLLFMRNVRSATYFEQMKGRGVRVVDADTLRSVTPDARTKTHFVIVDAVGICERDKTDSRPLDRQPLVPLDKLLGMVATGMAHPDLVSSLGARLARLDREISEEQREELREIAGGKDLKALVSDFLRSTDADEAEKRAKERHNIPEGKSPTEKQIDEAQVELMREALMPLHSPRFRDSIIGLRRSLDQVIDEQTQDELLRAGFDAQAREKARSLVTNFRKFIEENKEELEAIRLLYSQPYRSGLRYRHVKELVAAISRPPLSTTVPRIWHAFEAMEPEAVKGRGGNQVVDVIALVRHALDGKRPLVPYAGSVDERYQGWLMSQENAGVRFSPEQRKWLEAIKDHVATSLTIDEEDFDDPPLRQLGGLGKVYEVFGDRLGDILQAINEALAA